MSWLAFFATLVLTVLVDIAWVWYFIMMERRHKWHAPNAAALIAGFTGCTVYIISHHWSYILAGIAGAWIGTRIALRIK